jgi:hypothetical protein
MSRERSMNDPRPYFSDSSMEADEKFLVAARRAQAATEMIPHVLDGPDGAALHLGVARLGPPLAPTVVLVISGTHGVEGFAGAAVQTGLLSEPPPLPSGCALLFVHLLNPWGLAWNRREDHENIDVFRNLLYLDDPVTPHPLFDIVDEALDLAHFPEHTAERDARVLGELVAKYGGEQQLIAAIRRGQHHRPKSMGYHGDHACWSRKVLQDVLERHLAGCRKLAVLDIHTGFGGYGEALVMSYDPPADARHQRVRRWFDGDIYVPGADADIPPHARSPYGFIADWVPGVQVTAAILEFGTFPPDQYRDVFPANHYYHVYGDPRSEAGLRVGARYRHYLYPQEPQWFEPVWRRGRDAALRMLAGAADWAGG